MDDVFLGQAEGQKNIPQIKNIKAYKNNSYRKLDINQEYEIFIMLVLVNLRGGTFVHQNEYYSTIHKGKIKRLQHIF